jgi:cell wall-associated NlpC family hydrolase
MLNKFKLLSVSLLLFNTSCYIQTQSDPIQISHKRNNMNLDSLHQIKFNNRQSFYQLAPQEQKLILTIKNYLGTPYHYSGTSHKGMDCSGLIVKVYKEALDLDLPHNSKQLSQVGHRIYARQWKLGDLLFFQSGSRREVNHVGIYLTRTKFVHSSTHHGVVISDFLKDKYYRQRYAGARRLFTINESVD